MLPHSRGSTGTGAPAGTHQPVDARRHERNGHLSTSDPRVTSQSATDDWLITHRAGNARPEAGRVLQGLDEASGAPVDSVGRPRTPPWRPTPGRPRAGSSRASPRSREPQTRPRAILSVVHISPIRLSWTHTESMICVRYPCGASAGFSLLPRGRAHFNWTPYRPRASRDANVDAPRRHLGVFLLTHEVDLGRADVGVAGELPHLVHRGPVPDGVVDRRLA